jgi:hypothetical protein
LPDYVIRDFMQLRSWLRHTALSHLVCGRLDALTLSRTALGMNIRQSAQGDRNCPQPSGPVAAATTQNNAHDPLPVSFGGGDE